VGAHGKVTLVKGTTITAVHRTCLLDVTNQTRERCVLRSTIDQDLAFDGTGRLSVSQNLQIPSTTHCQHTHHLHPQHHNKSHGW
jgi:hypothetical protein